MPDSPTFTDWTHVLWNDIIGLAYPNICQFCFREKATKPEGYICETCRQKVQLIESPMCHVCGTPLPGNLAGVKHFVCSQCRETPPHFDWARASVATTDLILTAIHKYKYDKSLWIENWLSQILIGAAQKYIIPQDWDMIIPVPLHPRRKKMRGFNQAERLAKILSKHLQIPMKTDILNRIKETPTQTGLNREDRAANLKNAFALTLKLDLSGKRIILIDDVMTTGATLDAAATPLKKANADYICALSVSRGISPPL